MNIICNKKSYNNVDDLKYKDDISEKAKKGYMPKSA